MAHLWFVGYHFGPFHSWKGTDMCCFMVKKLPLWPNLSLVCYHYGPFMVGTLPLWPVLRLQSYEEASFIVGMLPLRPILWFLSYHYGLF